MKAKIIDYSNYILMLGLFIFGVIYSYINSCNIGAFYAVIGCFSAAALVNLFFIILKLLVIDSYDFKKYTPYLHASYLIGSILMYYLVKNLEHFDTWGWLYWTGLLVINLTCIIVFYILNSKAKEDKPRLIQNKR